MSSEYETRDKIVYERMREEFAYWDDIDIHFKGEKMKCRGNGFCGTSRVHLLSILHDRCSDVGVDLHFEQQIDPNTIEKRFADSDLVLIADGINSTVRDAHSGADGFDVAVSSPRIAILPTCQVLQKIRGNWRQFERLRMRG